MKIPWWLKILAKIIFSSLPFRYSLWQKLGLFRHGRMDESSYVIGVFDGHCERSNLGSDLKGRVILELGPGDSIGTAIMAASHGAVAILVDSGMYVSSSVEIYKSLAEDLNGIGLKAPNLSDAKDVNDILRICGSQYLTSGLSSIKELPSNSVDLIFSHAVLEHIRESDFLQTMIECKRVLKSNGVASHRVDLKDHLGGGLNNLRFAKNVWESDLFVSSGFYTNRIRISKMISLFKEAGFEIHSCRTETWDAIPISRDNLAFEFANMSEEDLLVKGFDVILR